MKKFIDILMYTLAAISSIIVICTFLTTYQFYYVNQIFNSYIPLQFSVSATMAILGIRFIMCKSCEKRYTYCAISFTICIFLLYYAINFTR